ncbi:hypothetical protein ILUMI_11091 [Ignelater luminosus]|uniref:Uncharacterized protein n=1 Tax=Ignelater luminosus TaxID=2038154 RepID=A0A8K0D0U2_IGNLU|nr:hypothetical protein ILUMI_11091 [Ignelater luminosus]
MKLIWSILFCYFTYVIQLTSGAVDDKGHPPTVVELNDTNFATTVAEGVAPWLVILYAGNSTFAAAALEDFLIAANVLKLIYKFGYIDYQKNPITMEMFKLITYDDATLFIFGDDRGNPRVILQAGTSWEISHFVKEGIESFHELLLWRLENYAVAKKPKRKPKELTEKNFLSVIAEQDYKGTYSPWLILFHSPDNLESQMLKVLYETAGAELFPKVRTAQIDVSKQRNLTQYFFDMIFLPTVIYVGKRSHSEAYSNPILPMPQMPTVGHICNFALSERLMDMSAFENNGISAVMLSVGDLAYNDARILQFNSNTSIHIFSRL